MDEVIKDDAKKFAKKLNSNFIESQKVLADKSVNEICSYFGLSEKIQKEQANNLANMLENIQDYYLKRIKLATTPEEREKLDEQVSNIYIKILSQQSELDEKHINERKFNKEKIVEIVKGIGSVLAACGALFFIANASSEDENNSASEQNDNIIDVDDI